MHYPQLKFAVVVFSCFVLAGCAGSAIRKPGELTPVEMNMEIVLEEGFEYEEKRGIGVLWREGLTAGTYRPMLRDEQGVYYGGPEKCVIQFMEKTSMGPYDGGIWIPDEGVDESPQIFFYFADNLRDSQDRGVLIDWLVQRDVGKLSTMIGLTDPEILALLEPGVAEGE